MVRWLTGLFSLALLAGCGDVSVVRLDVGFEDPTLEIETRALRVVYRTLPENPAEACVGFQSGVRPPGVLQGESAVAYPVEDPIQSDNIDLELYPQLTFIVLAYASLDIDTVPPIAGACSNIDVNTDGRTDVEVVLEAL